MAFMQSDSNARAVLVRGLSPRVYGALQGAADDIGIAQAAVVKLALRDWLTDRGYLIAAPVAPQAATEREEGEG